MRGREGSRTGAGGIPHSIPRPGKFHIRSKMMMLVSGHDQAPVEPLKVRDHVLTRAAPSRVVPAIGAPMSGALRNARVE